MSAGLVGRAELLERLRALLGAGDPVVLTGRRGVGRSAVLDEVARTHPGEARQVLRAGGVAAERHLAYRALHDLADQVAQPRPDTDSSDPRRSTLDLLAALSTDEPTLVLIDDVDMVDEPSLEALAFACRRLRGRVQLVVSHESGAPVSAALDLPGLVSVEVPPLDSAATVELLGAHGVSPRAAARLHVEAGGVPAFALALGGAVGDRPALLGRPTTVPPELERVLAARLDELDPPVAGTLLRVALLARPGLRVLERAGRIDAEDHLRTAAEHGLVERVGSAVRFTPPMLGRLLVERAGAAARLECHRELADAATSEAERARHLALADARPDAEVARGLAAHAAGPTAAGHRALAAELYLLAAHRATSDLGAERSEWLARSVEAGATGDAPDPTYAALEEFWDAEATPEQRVRVRLALLELAGTTVMAMEEVLTAALADAGTDERLVAGVLLQRARLLMGDSRPVDAGLAAEEAVHLLRGAAGSDPCPEDRLALATALPVLAVARRWTGRGAHDGVLAEALELRHRDGPAPGEMVHTSPGYMAARFALYDDRLGVATSEFTAMLGRAERGPASDRVHLLRSLVEVAVRRGDCEAALHHAGRAAALAEEHHLAPYSVWFVSALAEMAGGGLDNGLGLAERGAEVAAAERDNRYLQRHLILVGHARLRRGEAGLAAEALRRVEAIEDGHGISDPTVNRWQPDLVSALLALGKVEEAESVLLRARRALDGRGGTAGVAAQLDRVEAELLTARGETYDAAELLDRSEKVCRDLDLGLDVGRAMLTRAHLERRRRRAAAAREALATAHAHFTTLRARPWLSQLEAEQQGTAGSGPVPDGGDDVLAFLTDAERGVAMAVAEGATNRETAERLWLSVKTVEAALTRIYRKLGVRSRTELVALVRERS